MIETVPTSLNGSMITAGLILVAAYVLIFTEVIHRMHAAVIGNGIAKASGDPEMLLLTCIMLMWVAALLSAIVDNIPFTVTMIPIVPSLDTQGMNVTPLWWALVLGVGLGGNGSHIGATANIICVTESERCQIPGARITPVLWLRKGLPIMLVSLTVASTVFALFFDFFL